MKHIENVIYFDNAATSWPKPGSVLEAMRYYLEEVGGSPGRSGHIMAIIASRFVEDTREAVANIFNCPDTSRVIFTKNITEALNIGILSLLKPGDHVVTSSVEHNSVMRPLRSLEQDGVSLSIVNCSSDGSLDPHDVVKHLKRNTRLVVLTHASNVTGTILPIEEVASITRERNIPFLVDCAQTAGALPIKIDLQTFPNCILAFTGHKSLLGPTGTGGMCLGADIHLSPLIRGGTGSKSDQDTQPEFLPDKLESGTLNIIGLMGLKAGIEFLIQEEIVNVRAHEKTLVKTFMQKASQLQELTIYGPQDPEKQVGLILFNVKHLSPSMVGLILERQYALMCRVGLHCNPNAHQTLGTFPDGAVRFGFSYFNTVEQVERSVAALQEIVTQTELKI